MRNDLLFLDRDGTSATKRLPQLLDLTQHLKQRCQHQTNRIRKGSYHLNDVLLCTALRDICDQIDARMRFASCNGSEPYGSLSAFIGDLHVAGAAQPICASDAERVKEMTAPLEALLSALVIIDNAVAHLQGGVLH